MRSLSKILLVLAVIAVILSFGVQQAKADSLLFPYFKSGGGAYTFVSLYSWTGGTVNVAYYYDLLSTAGKECIHEDHTGTLTAKDIFKYEVTKQVDLKTLFGDASAMSLIHLYVPNTQGFFIVQMPIEPEADHGGQAAIVDTASGLVTAYKALNNPLSTDPNLWNNQIVSKTSFDMTNYPSPTVTTSWFVLVTGSGMFTGANAIPSYLGHVHLNNAVDMVWDKDEHMVSGNKEKTITCFDFITRSDIMQPGQVTNSDGGGYWWERVTDMTNGATGALMIKVESTTALGGAMQTISLENAYPNWPY